jgi:aminotransferase
MSDISKFGFADDVTFNQYLVEKIGVTTVPGSSFFGNKADGKSFVRFCFSRRDETLNESRRRLVKMCEGEGRASR